jgi:hypothetical protein
MSALFHRGEGVEPVSGARPKDHFEPLIDRTRAN